MASEAETIPPWPERSSFEELLRKVLPLPEEDPLPMPSREEGALVLIPISPPEPPEIQAREIDTLDHLRQRSERLNEEETPPPHKPVYATPDAQRTRIIELLQELNKGQKTLIAQGREANSASLGVAIQASGAITQASSALTRIAEEGCKQGIERFTGSKKVADLIVLAAGGAVVGAFASLTEYGGDHFLNFILWLTGPGGP